MEIHCGEGQGVGEMQPHHHHPRYPEEENVEAGLQQLSGVEGLEVVGLVGPAEDGEGEQTGTEPGVQHVLILI